MGHGQRGIKTDRYSMPKGVPKLVIEGTIHIRAHLLNPDTVHPGRRTVEATIDITSQHFAGSGSITAFALVKPEVLERIKPGKQKRARIHLMSGGKATFITHVQVGSDTIPVMPP